MGRNVIELEGVYNNYTVTKQGIQKLKFTFGFDELPKGIKMVSALMIDCRLYIKADNYTKKKKIGSVRINNITIDKEGNYKVELHGDGLNIPNINDLVDCLTMVYLVYEEDDYFLEEEYEGEPEEVEL